MKYRMDSIIKCLRQAECNVSNISVVVGFDGFVDEIIRVVKKRNNSNDYLLFNSISEFSSHLLNAAGKSADMEIITEDIRFGGNAPIMANALTCFGINTTCIGALGYPEVDGVFGRIIPECNKISICNPGHTYDFEFDDGKLMFADIKPLENLTWDNIKSLLGMDKIMNIFKSSSLIALVDWSLSCGIQSVWKGIRDEILPHVGKNGTSRVKLYFDLADPSKRAKEDIGSVLRLISECSEYCSVTLGLNENEARCIYNALQDDAWNYQRYGEAYNIEEVGRHIFKSMDIDALLIHRIDSCIGVTKEDVFIKKGKYIKHPKVSIGGGDNFNAGYCLGQVLRFGIEDSMITGMAASGAYIKNGCSPDIDGLAGFLKEWDGEEIE